MSELEQGNEQVSGTFSLTGGVLIERKEPPETLMLRANTVPDTFISRERRTEQAGAQS